jgi:hypothetical protein
MSVNARAKGARGEREFAAMVYDHLGIRLQRNLEQTRCGGFDLLGMHGWAIEVKNTVDTSPAALRRHWKQTVRQAEGTRPMLAVKVPRNGWDVIIRDDDYRGVAEDEREPDLLVRLSFDTWARWFRETL